MKIVALIAAYNEARFIGPCLDHLSKHGVQGYLIDNESTDDTVAIAREYIGRNLLGIETFPRLGRFRWTDLLCRKAELAAALDADWFINLDPDEFLEPPEGRGTLAEALAREEAAGFTAVNFAELVFVPTQEHPEHDGPEFQSTMRWYYPYALSDQFRIIAWRKQSHVIDLVTHGGHRAEFPGRSVSPLNFLMRHYLCLGRDHAQRKFGGRLYDAGEVSRGWHGWRTGPTGDITLPAESRLRDRIIDGLDPRRPIREHLILPRALAPSGPVTVARLDAPWSRRAGDAVRIGIDINGEALWFESADVDLEPAAEGLLAMLLLPALIARTQLETDHRVCPVWLRNMEQFLLVCRSWWGLPGILPLCANPHDEARPPEHVRRWCCFTGGVDSFHSLRTSGLAGDTLFFVHGFDIPLAERTRGDRVADRLRQVADAAGRRFVHLRSNAREHTFFNRANWIQTHGTALAAVGHLLGAACTDLVIPSSDVQRPDHAWGSHWRTDPLLGSAQLRVHNDAPFVSRIEKIRQLAGDELFLRNVRVCWEGQEDGNCGRCEKCLRTMVTLEGVGALDQATAFRGKNELAERLDSLPRIPAHHLDLWDAIAPLARRDSTRAAMERLLRRSTTAP